MGYALYTLANIKFYEFYRLVPFYTDALTMSSVSGLCSKCVNVLCLNFVILLWEQYDEQDPVFVTGFAEFYQAMLAVPFFGTTYNYVMPILIVIIGILTLFKFTWKTLKVTRKLVGSKKTLEEEAEDKKP